MKVRFTADFDFSPAELKGTVTTAYKQGETHTVTRECADQAVAAGKGEIVKGRRGASEEGV